MNEADESIELLKKRERAEFYNRVVKPRKKKIIEYTENTIPWSIKVKIIEHIMQAGKQGEKP